MPRRRQRAPLLPHNAHGPYNADLSNGPPRMNHMKPRRTPASRQLSHLTPALVCLSCAIPVCAAPPDLKRDGAFGFQQKDATVLCDTRDLRLSAFNDSQYLFVQAVLWNDHEDVAGETEDGRKIGDDSALLLDLDADG